MVEEKPKDSLEQAIESMEKYYHERGRATCGDITVLWTGITGEENLLVYNNKTRKVLYEEHPLIGMDADYDVPEIAAEFAQGRFFTDGSIKCTSYRAGTYGPNGLITTAPRDELPFGVQYCLLLGDREYED